MTENDVRDTIGTAPLPRPRTAADDSIPTGPDAAAPRSEAPHFPWPEPWHYSRAARPRTEFWDVTTASWRSRGPVRDRGTTD